MHPLFKLELTGEPDLVAIRRSVRRLTRVLEFDHQDQIRITTAVSELTRGAAGGTGSPVTIEFFVHNDPLPQLLVVQVTGPGLDRSNRMMRSESNERFTAARRLLSPFDRLPAPQGPTVRLSKTLPERLPFVDADGSKHIRADLAQHQADTRSYRDELSEQSLELSATLLELEQKRQEVSHLSAELGDTNRGVVALYAELDERAQHLRRADELKTKFFSYMSHEFKTPLNSILALSRLLLQESDGKLNTEQAKQVRLIRDSTSDLLDLVSDLLDFSKVEAGKSSVVVVPFSISTLFGALRGVIRPLLSSSDVVLEFETADGLPLIVSDEGKIAQILRNFLSNAVKFTERGSITVKAEALRAGQPSPTGDGSVPQDSILFSVVDTGIGIRGPDQEAIFQEWSQVKHSLQRRVRGTGLGLRLCRSLAALLGGQVWVESELGRGSTFHLLVPRVHESRASDSLVGDSLAVPLLIVSDAPVHRAALEELFTDGLFTPVSTGADEMTEELIQTVKPTVAVVEASAKAAAEMIQRTRLPRPVILESLTLPARATVSDDIVETVYGKLLRAELGRVLVVDNDDRFRTILLKHLERFCSEAVSTGDPTAVPSMVVERGIDSVILDLMMPRLDGFELLERLRASSDTRSIAVLVCSSKALSDDERSLLRRMHAAFIPKDELEPPRLARGLLEATLLSRAGSAVTSSAAATDL